MPLPAVLGTVLSVGSTALSVGSKVASVAGRGVATAARAGRAMGRRRKGRRDRIQEQLFGRGGGESRGGSMVPSPGGAIVPFSNTTTSKRVTPTPTAGSGILGILNSIRSSLEQILEVEKQQRDSIQDSILNFARTGEQDKRTAEQQKQEAKKPTRKRDRVGGAVKNLAAGPLAILQDFIKLGILNWMGDPANREAVQNIVKFFQGMVKVLKWTWKWIVAPMFKVIEIIGGPVLKTFGSFFTLLGNLFTGKIFTDPGEFFRSLLDFPVQLINMIPDIIGGFIRWIGGALWGAASGIIGGIIDAIRNLFGGIFGGGKKSSDSMSTNFAGGPMPGAGADGQPGKDGADGKDGKDSAGDKEPSKLQKLTDGGYKFDDQGVNAAGQRVITHTGPEHGQKFSKGLMGTLGIGNMGQYEKRQTGRKIITGSKANDSLEDIVAGDENLQVPQRGIGNRLLGGIDVLTGNLTDFDQKGGDPFGSGRALGGIVDIATGGLTDMDKRGGKPFGLMRGFTGAADFLTGNRFDLDKRGKSGSILDEVQKESQTLDSVSDQTNQEVYAFGDQSHTGSEEVGDPATLGNNFPRTGVKPYKTSL